MTDNEIIKALECCTRSCCSDNETKDCSLKPFEDCSTRLASNALDLIKRLQSQNDRDVKVKVEALYKVNDLKIENEHQKAEIERLEYTLLGVMHSVDKWLEGEELEQDEVNRAIAMREKTLQIVEEKQAEIERLNETKDEWKLSAINKARRVDELTNEIAKLKFSSMIGSTRAEAIKEFAELLKASSCIRYVDEMTGEVYQMIISGSTIDYLVKKMTEGV